MKNILKAAFKKILPASLEDEQKAFFTACRDNDPNTVERVLKKYPDAVQWMDKDDFGFSGLQYAAGKSALAVCSLLLDHNADINYKNYYGDTALHCAIKSHTMLAAQYLVDRKADIDIVSAGGDTPLMSLCAYISSNSDTSFVRFARQLIEAGARLDVRNRDDLSAEMLARRVANPCWDVVNTLQEQREKNVQLATSENRQVFSGISQAIDTSKGKLKLHRPTGHVLT